MDLGKPAGAPGRIALPVADDIEASNVIRLLDELGFDGVDAGGLDESWCQQPGSPVYATDFDVAGVKRALSEATKERKPEWRATETAPVVLPSLLNRPLGTHKRSEDVIQLFCARFATLRIRKLTNVSNSLTYVRRSSAVRLDDIVPLAVELVGININLLHFFGCNFASGWILAAIQPARYRQPFRGSRFGNEIHDGFVIPQWFPPPIG